jgi:predicted nucleic acid-binding protein
VILVFDSSSLIALGRIGRLSLVHELGGDVHVREAAFEEVAEPASERPGSAEVRSAPGIHVHRVLDREAVDRLRGRLGRGEAESIVLARQLSADFLVLDDAAARRAARTEGARVIGLLGLLVHAHERGTIAELKPLLAELKASGFYIGESLYQALLRRVGET